MKHARCDQLVPLKAIDEVIAALQIEEERALRFEVLKADGKSMQIPFDFAIGRSGGIAWAIKALRELEGV